MEINGGGQTAAAVGMLAKAMKIEAQKGDIITKTFQAIDQMKTNTGQSDANLSKSVQNNNGIGKRIDKIV